MSTFRHRPRSGLSLLEVLLTLVILALILVPIIRVFTASHRIGYSAKRLVDVVVHVQALVEALAELEPADFPVPPGDTTDKLLMDDEGKQEPGNTARYKEICDFFQRKPPVEGMKRELSAKRLATGEVEVRVHVTWTAVQGEQRTQQELTIPMLATPRNWQ